MGIVTIIITLGKNYYEPKHAAGFGSAPKLVKASKTNKGAVEVWLSGQNTYTLHKPVRKRFPRNPYNVTSIDDLGNGPRRYKLPFEINEKYKYLLKVIDIFSRYACNVPLRYKIGTYMTAELKYLFRDRKPITIQSDKGTEFVNATVQITLNVRKLISIQLTIPN